MLMNNLKDKEHFEMFTNDVQNRGKHPPNSLRHFQPPAIDASAREFWR